MHTFYAKGLTTTQTSFTMDEPTSKYCIQVLRMSIGDTVQLADGLGHKYTATISDDNRKKAVLTVNAFDFIPRVTSGLHIAIAFTKNVSRMEWFLEKAVEIGVTAITPLLTHRTEREKFKAERFENILVSAMLQSQQFWLPVLSEPSSFSSVISVAASQRFIAHCLPESKTHFVDAIKPGSDGLILIGPEGDFTGDEISLALSSGFVPVSLGDTRLRTETAGMVAGALWVGVNR